LKKQNQPITKIIQLNYNKKQTTNSQNQPITLVTAKNVRILMNENPISKQIL